MTCMSHSMWLYINTECSWEKREEEGGGRGGWRREGGGRREGRGREEGGGRGEEGGGAYIDCSFALHKPSP